MSLPIVQSIGVVVLNDDKVLLVKHGKTAHHFEGVVGIPSGKIDPGETAMQAAIRELQEETGLITTEDKMTPFPKPYRATIKQKDGRKVFVWYVFLCRDYKGKLVSSDETVPEWVNINKLDTMKLLPNVKKATLAAKKMV